MSYITNLKIDNDTLSFELNNNNNDINISLANAIRRTIISDIKCYTIDEKNTNFFKNNSILNSELLKHRLILIPIISNLENINYDNLLISCNVNNDGENIKSVYVENFICKDNENIIENKIIFKYTNILFAKLKYNQELIFEAKLIRNNSEEGGSFFSTVSQCIYTFKIDKKKVDEIIKDMNEVEKKSFLTQESQRIFEKNNEGNPKVFQFVIESIGFYDTKYILDIGLNLLIERLNLTKNEFRNKNSKKISFIDDEENLDFFKFLIDNENETIGNLIQTYLTYDENVYYCGYKIDHPLKKNILLKIKLNNDNNLENVILMIEKTINKIVNLLNIFLKEL